jgi:hypothetical protein
MAVVGAARRSPARLTPCPRAGLTKVLVGNRGAAIATLAQADAMRIGSAPESDDDVATPFHLIFYDLVRATERRA